MHLFVTGVGSFVGRALSALCEQRGIRVSGIDTRPVEHAGATVADIRDRARLLAVIPNDVDAIVHLAALSRDQDCKGRAIECLDVNVMGTLNLIDAARQKGARQFIFASSEWVYDSFEPGIDKTEDDTIDASRLTSEYALSKFVSEVNLRQAYRQGFCPVSILRFGIIYGPRTENWSAVEALFDSVAKRDEMTVGSLQTARRFLHVADVASAILASVGIEGIEIFNVQGPRLTSLGDIIACGAKLLGRNPRVVETNSAAPSIRTVSDDKIRRRTAWRPYYDLDLGLRSVAPAIGLSVLDAR
jgi:UDP-glucose 4-epimerase